MEVSADVSASFAKVFASFAEVSASLRKFLRFTRRNFPGSLAEICTKFRINLMESN